MASTQRAERSEWALEHDFRNARIQDRPSVQGIQQSCQLWNWIALVFQSEGRSQMWEIQWGSERGCEAVITGDTYLRTVGSKVQDGAETGRAAGRGRAQWQYGRD